jgi:hypothetical protein
MTREIPFEHCILLDEFVEVSHKFVYCFSHVHVSDSRPNGVQVRQRGGLIFISPNRRLKFISVVHVSWGAYQILTHLRILCAILDGEQVINHSLISKFMNKGGKHVH